jgi:hypothetical protein
MTPYILIYMYQRFPDDRPFNIFLSHNLKSHTHTLTHTSSTHAEMRMPPATAQKMIGPTAYSRSIHELGVCQFVTWNRDVQNNTEMVWFILTLYASRQVAPPSAFPHTRCNLRGADIITLLLYVYCFTYPRAYCTLLLDTSQCFACLLCEL